MNATEWLADLEAKADVATPGKWVIDSNFRGAVNCGKKHIALANYFNACDEESRVTNTGANADFIAAANPDTVKRWVMMIEHLAILACDTDEQAEQNIQWAFEESDPKEYV